MEISINILVALGTLVLAFATWKMAVATNQSVQVSQQMARIAQQQAESAKEQAATSKSALLSSVQPLLAEVPLPTQSGVRERDPFSLSRDRIDAIYVSNFESERRFFISVPCGNIGHGPAIITRVRLTTVDGIDIEAESIAVRIVQAGGITRANFVVTDLAYAATQIPRKDEYPDFSVEITYTNAYGIDTRISQIDIKRREKVGSFAVVRVQLLASQGDSHPAEDQRSIGSLL